MSDRKLSDSEIDSLGLDRKLSDDEVSHLGLEEEDGPDFSERQDSAPHERITQSRTSEHPASSASAAVQSFGHHLPFGNNVAAFIAASANKLKGNEGPDFWDTYKAYKTMGDRDASDIAYNQPIANRVGQGAAIAAQMALPAARIGRGLSGALASGAANGALYGAAGGLENSGADLSSGRSGDYGKAAWDTAKGSLAGLAVGAGLGAGGFALGKGSTAVQKYLASKLNAARQSAVEAADKLAAKSATTDVASALPEGIDSVGLDDTAVRLARQASKEGHAIRRAGMLQAHGVEGSAEDIAAREAMLSGRKLPGLGDDVAAEQAEVRRAASGDVTNVIRRQDIASGLSRRRADAAPAAVSPPPMPVEDSAQVANGLDPTGVRRMRQLGRRSAAVRDERALVGAGINVADGEVYADEAALQAVAGKPGLPRPARAAANVIREGSGDMTSISSRGQVLPDVPEPGVEAGGFIPNKPSPLENFSKEMKSTPGEYVTGGPVRSSPVTPQTAGARPAPGGGVVASRNAQASRPNGPSFSPVPFEDVPTKAEYMERLYDMQSGGMPKLPSGDLVSGAVGGAWKGASAAALPSFMGGHGQGGMTAGAIAGGLKGAYSAMDPIQRAQLLRGTAATHEVVSRYIGGLLSRSTGPAEEELGEETGKLGHGGGHHDPRQP